MNTKTENDYKRLNKVLLKNWSYGLPPFVPEFSVDRVLIWTLITTSGIELILAIVLLLAIVNRRKNWAKNKWPVYMQHNFKTHNHRCFCYDAFLSNILIVGVEDKYFCFRPRFH